MKSFEEYNSNKITINFIFEKLFEARDNAHLLHLASHSYSEHIALNEFYDNLLNKIDEFAEVYQGQYALLDFKVPGTNLLKDSKIFLGEFSKFLKENRDFFEDEHLKNLWDEITSLTYRTLYKIRFLK